MLLAEALDKHLAWMEQAHYSPATIEARRAVLSRFAAVANGSSAEDLRQAHAAAWRDSRLGHIRDSTLAKESSHLQGCFDWLRERDYITSELVALPRAASRLLDRAPDPDRRRFITTPRLQAILRAMPPDRRSVCAVLACTGLRIGELASLPVTSWNATRSCVWVPRQGAQRTKRHERDIPVGPTIGHLLDHAKARLNGAAPTDPLFPALRHRVGHWLRGFGISPHDLRRWYNDTLRRLGCPKEIRGVMMGHTPSRRDGAYEKPREDELRPWVQRISDELMGEPPCTTSAIPPRSS